MRNAILSCGILLAEHFFFLQRYEKKSILGEETKGKGNCVRVKLKIDMQRKFDNCNNCKMIEIVIVKDLKK